MTALLRQAPLVLLVDDQPDTSEMYGEFLRICGFRSIAAGDGLDALDVFSTARPDIVVSDLLLPRLDGFNLASRLKQQPAARDIPLIAVTGLAHIAYLDRARAAGFDLVLTKPCLPDALAFEIRRLLTERAIVRLRAAANDLREAGRQSRAHSKLRAADGVEQPQPIQEVWREDDAMRAQLDRSATALLLADDEGRYIDANDGACELTGYAREELTRLAVWDLTPSMDMDEARLMWRRFVERGELEGEYAIRRKDAKMVRVRFSASANIVPHLHLSALAVDVPPLRRSAESGRQAEA